MNLTRHVPNALTCANLLCGCLGIIFCLENSTVPTAYFVWAAGVFDFFDGFAARWLKVESPIGKELDSLADMVSFGVLPAVLMYQMIDAASDITLLAYAGLLIAVCAALRLAVFNIDETQHNTFKGLNTPANTIFITGLPFLTGQLGAFVQQSWVLVGITVIFSILMVSRINILAFKFKDFSWRQNQARFTFLGAAVLLVLVWGKAAVSPIILLYIGFSLGSNALTQKSKVS